MRVALISDIHGNVAALEAVAAELANRSIDQMVCLGDVAVFGPQPRQALARLRRLNCPVVMGNTDGWLLEPQPHEIRDENSQRFADIETWGAEQVTAEELAYVRTFQSTVEIRLAENASLLCFHGSPKSYHDIIVATTPDDELKGMLDGVAAAVLAGGHTHTQLLRRYLGSIIVNPGSVGLPYERIARTGELRNPPWAEYAVVSWENGRLAVELGRVPYDVTAVVRAAEESGMPHVEWWTRGWRKSIE